MGYLLSHIYSGKTENFLKLCRNDIFGQNPYIWFMQQHWEFDIGNSTLSRQSSFLKKDEIVSFLQNEQRALDIFLSYYCKSEGAIAENTEITGEFTLDENQRGNFKVKYDKIHYNACLNIHEQEKDEMELNFLIDPENLILKLTGPDWPERDTDDI